MASDEQPLVVFFPLSLLSINPDIRSALHVLSNHIGSKNILASKHILRVSVRTS